ncbi:hypothetical protein BGW39_010018 [Mortierella sp. 14UC]|nr:hypothetical protein BGW39_010018 [Mortierella sp. 14UC]
MVEDTNNFGSIKRFLIAHDRLYLFSEKAELNAPTNTNAEPVEMIGYGMYTGVYYYRAIGGNSIGGGAISPQFLVYTKDRELYTLKLDGQDRAMTDLGRIKVSDPSGRPESRGLEGSGAVAATVVSIVVVVLLGVLVARCYSRMRKNKAMEAAQDIAQAEAEPDAPVDTDSKSTAISGPNSSRAASLPADLTLTPEVQSIPPHPPTTVLPMAPITPTSQEQQTVQNQMQELGFSIHPRPTVASAATGAPWQPTPFIPPGSAPRIRSPEQDNSAPSEPSSPSLPPPVPRTSRPRPEVGTQPIQPAFQHPHT